MATGKTREGEIAPTVCCRSSANLTPKPGFQRNLHARRGTKIHTPIHPASTPPIPSHSITKDPRHGGKFCLQPGCGEVGFGQDLLEIADKQMVTCHTIEEDQGPETPLLDTLFRRNASCSCDACPLVMLSERRRRACSAGD
jgi:hypothetical protein